MYQDILIICLLLPLVSSLPKCENTRRENVQFYFDRTHKMCLGYRTECSSRISINERMFSTEEECTLATMGSMWKTVKIRCPPDLRMAVFNRTNGDTVPILFSSQLCYDDGFSDICEKGETCNTVGWMAFCCNDEAFLGNGPNSGLFNITGIGGPVNHIRGGAVPDKITQAPENCNEDGDRNEVEWYRNPSGNCCVSQRMHCSVPKFGRKVRRDVFPDEQSCMDFNFPEETFTRIFDCKDNGYAVATNNDGTPLIFEKQLCGGPHDSDYCNRDEFCMLMDDNVGYCCQKSMEGPLKYSSFGRNAANPPPKFVHGTRMQFPNVRFFPMG